ncbi:hypothetical protein GPJ56_003615 [Histomonas meleagridis]|uniref:uncharacterized protein n=1 Tax=Histomonas meleagridis TaxID=135588 RepID=UPI00355998DC|nr:hypothetical protein GPJ56_003615 [Histomonas meleagridis]KAH0800685.1 hypothetical protein GO595_006438 [Histomonas meleagridis]
MRTTEKRFGTTTARKFDSIISTERVTEYDKMARNLNPAPYRNDMIKHYDELARLNRKHHDLNYPLPANARTYGKTKKRTKPSYLTSRLLNSSDRNTKSPYTSTTTVRQPPQVRLKDHILKKAMSGSFPEKEKIIALVAKSLASHGMEKESILLALADVQLNPVINQETSEIEIILNL